MKTEHQNRDEDRTNLLGSRTGTGKADGGTGEEGKDQAAAVGIGGKLNFIPLEGFGIYSILKGIHPLMTLFSKFN